MKVALDYENRGAGLVAQGEVEWKPKRVKDAFTMKSINFSGEVSFGGAGASIDIGGRLNESRNTRAQ